MDKDRVRELIISLYEIVDELEAMFPGRKFTPDGHLLGSIGEAIAVYCYEVQLLPNSSPVHDAKKGDLYIQIKATQIDRVSFSAADVPQHVLVLRLSRNAPPAEVFNGKGDHLRSLMKSSRPQKNGQIQITLQKLRNLMKSVDESERIKLVRQFA